MNSFNGQYNRRFKAAWKCQREVKQTAVVLPVRSEWVSIGCDGVNRQEIHDGSCCSLWIAEQSSPAQTLWHERGWKQAPRRSPAARHPPRWEETAGESGRCINFLTFSDFSLKGSGCKSTAANFIWMPSLTFSCLAQAEWNKWEF